MLLSAAVFVLVVAVVTDLDATVSGVQAAIALEALVSAAFILISSKVGDLIGRPRRLRGRRPARAVPATGCATGVMGGAPGSVSQSAAYRLALTPT